MAIVASTFTTALDGVIPVYAGSHRASEAITSSASSQQTTNTASGVPGEVCRVTSSGGAVWVTTGSSNPTAAAGTGFLVPDGGTIDLGRLQSGWKIAVIDA